MKRILYKEINSEHRHWKVIGCSLCSSLWSHELTVGAGCCQAFGSRDRRLHSRAMHRVQMLLIVVPLNSLPFKATNLCQFRRKPTKTGGKACVHSVSASLVHVVQGKTNVLGICCLSDSGQKSTCMSHVMGPSTGNQRRDGNGELRQGAFMWGLIGDRARLIWIFLSTETEMKFHFFSTALIWITVFLIKAYLSVSICIFLMHSLHTASRIVFLILSPLWWKLPVGSHQPLWHSFQNSLLIDFHLFGSISATLCLTYEIVIFVRIYLFTNTLVGLIKHRQKPISYLPFLFAY